MSRGAPSRPIPGSLAAFASALLVTVLSPAAGDESVPGRAPGKPPAPRPGFDETLYLPLRVHVLEAGELPQVHSKLKDEEIARRVTGADRIWSQAGVRVYLESVIREPAAGQARFKLAAERKAVPLGLYRALAPDESRSTGALDVYLVNELPVNGVYFDKGEMVFLKEKPRLEPVEGGTDYPPERVLSHEIGHYLGLGHVADRSLLMASGTTGFMLDAEAIRKARQAAAGADAVSTPEAMLKRAAEEARGGRTAAGRARLEALLATPGESELKERARRALRELGAEASPR